MVMSSVAVDTELRKRLKQLAASKDTTQAAVINEALDLLEEKMEKNQHVPTKHPGRQILEDFIKEIDLEDWEIELVKKLKEKGPDIDDLRMEFYEFE